MEFWNDYEGKFFAERFEIGRLLRSEGRSAQFHVIDVAGGKRAEAVLRMTESLNGEHAMLDCWRKVQAAKEPHLIEIRETGETTYEGVPLTWALLEKHDMELSDILRERLLTATEATDVARALVAAVKALHAQGLVHDAIVTESVQAVGETAKLRSDAVRVCVEDQEFVSAEEYEARRLQDVVAVAATVLESLTGRREPTGLYGLQEPLGAMIRHGFDGSWTLEQMGAHIAPPPPAPVVVETAPAATPEVVAPAVASVPVTAAASVRPGTGASAVEPGKTGRLPFPEPTSPVRSAQAAGERRIPMRTSRPAQDRTGRRRPLPVALIGGRSPRFLGACAVALLVILAIGWAVLRPRSVNQPQAAAVAPAAPAVTTSNVAAVPAVAPTPSAAVAAPEPPVPAPTPESRYNAGWRVVVYTYHHEEQAIARAAKLRERFAAMRPHVFNPQDGVYLVALGGPGPLSEQEAETLRSRARRSGLPGDTFIRNYRPN